MSVVSVAQRHATGVLLECPLSSMPVTVRGSLAVGRDVIRLPNFQSCSSAPEVNGRWKLRVGSKEQQTSHSQRFLILFLLLFWMKKKKNKKDGTFMPGHGPSRRNHQEQDQGRYIRERSLFPLAFSRAVPVRLRVTSKSQHVTHT